MRMKNRKFRSTFRATPVVVALAVLLGSVGSAGAFNILSDNPDIFMMWDQTVRYNLGMRVKERDPGLASNLGAQDESNYLFDRNDIINNRVEWFSEFDFKYQDRMGFRISGQAWYDNAYDTDSKAYPGTALSLQNIKGEFNDETKKYYRGPDAELLDHFVWIQGKLGETSAVARVGNHAMIWGEGMVGNTQAVSYAMAPSDGRKSLSSPGASAKETALPIYQTTGTWQFLDNASLSWQYVFKWRSNNLALGGTYLGADPMGPWISGTIPRVDAEEGKRGAYGLMLRWRPRLLGADLGFVYRKFSDTNPWAAQISAGPGPIGLVGRYVYARDIELLGFTFNKGIGDHLISGEISHRSNMALNSLSGNAGAAFRYEGAIGDTWHALLNDTIVFNENPVWDNAALVVELQYVGLDKVTKHGQFYKSKSNTTAAGIAACGGKDEVLFSCSTNNFYLLAAIFTSNWLQVFHGADFALQGVYVAGLKGTAPTNGGGNESSGQYKISAIIDYKMQHKLDLSYTAFLGDTAYTGATSNGIPVKTTVGGGIFRDRDYVSLTYTFNF